MSVREIWIDQLVNIVEKPLNYLANGKTWVIENRQEQQPTIGYLETLARIVAGIAPWLALPDDSTEESTRRVQIRELVIRAITENYATFNWKVAQSLVEAAYLAQGFLRARATLWDPLPEIVRTTLIEKFKGTLVTRKEKPYTLKSNWILFYGMVQAFLVMVNAEPDHDFIKVIIQTVEGFYIGDGFYRDGDVFRIDFYNSYVFHSMYIEMLTVLGEEAKREIAIKRMTQYSEFLESIISPDGSYPPLGRSIAYRFAAFQPIGHCVLLNRISTQHSYGQLRRALTSVMTKLFIKNSPFIEGFLALGLCGHQPEIVQFYTNSGSLYVTTLGFIVLGLPEEHSFWKDKEDPTTQERCWSGATFPPYNTPRC
jgi:hypothetical protein